jgi:hypothetical protein
MTALARLIQSRLGGVLTSCRRYKILGGGKTFPFANLVSKHMSPILSSPPVLKIQSSIII